MELKWKLHQCNIKWRSTTGTRIIMEVHHGMLVRYIAVRVGEIFDGINALTIGDKADATKFGAVTYGSKQLENLIGEYLCTDNAGGPNANGKLYGADNDIRATMTVTGSPSAGEATVSVVYAEIE